MLDSFTHTEKQSKDKFQITSRHLTRLYSHFLRNWLTEICQQKKRKTLPVQFTLRLKLRCGMHNNESENVVLAKVQRCEESFIGTFVKKRKFACFLQEVPETNYPEVWRCQKSPGFVKSSDTLPVLFSGKWNCWGVFFFPPHPKKNPGWKKKITASVSTLRVWI